MNSINIEGIDSNVIMLYRDILGLLAASKTS